MVTVNLDTSIHGLVDPFDPYNVTAIVYLSSQTFAVLLQDVQSGPPQTVTETCDAQNNVTAFDWYPHVHLAAKLFEYVAQTSETLEGLNAYVRATIPNNLKQQLEGILEALIHVGKQVGLRPSETPPPFIAGKQVFEGETNGSKVPS
jgi:hypothetical protein